MGKATALLNGMVKMSADDKQKKNTKLLTTGRPSQPKAHLVNTPPHRSSTVLFPTYEDFESKNKPFIYGRFGTQTHRDFEASVCALENAQYALLAPSGLAAITQTILTLAKASSHILVTDSAYDPVRGYCDQFLSRFDIQVEYYNPRIGGDIGTLIRENTALILAESPGSLTFEIQDIPAFSKIAKKHDIPLLVDNTWGVGVLHAPLSLGADISIISATKYISGHADCLLGTVVTNCSKLARKLRKGFRQLGSNVSADDVYLAHRGLRTLTSRLQTHEKNALALANWLSGQPEVECLVHPAFPSHPDHQIWKRDFTGSNGLFGVALKDGTPSQIRAFFNELKIFGMGYSWGGYESLLIPTKPNDYRTVAPWPLKGPLFRIHAGLEEIDDLIHDLGNAFGAFRREK